MNSRNLATLFSRASDEWPTPDDFYRACNARFGFTLDPCATPENAKCPRYFTKSDNGLILPWSGTVWVNPPYSDIGNWVRKCLAESLRGATVVALVPARTDTAWFHDYVLQGEIEFIRGRLKFGDAKWNAPFPSMLVVYRPGALRAFKSKFFE